VQIVKCQAIGRSKVTYKQDHWFLMFVFLCLLWWLLLVATASAEHVCQAVTYRQSEKSLLSSNICCTCPHSVVNFSPLTAEIGSGVWGTPANFSGFRVLASLLHDTPELGVSQTLHCWTEGATYIPQIGHHVGHWPTFLVCVELDVKPF